MDIIGNDGNRVIDPDIDYQKYMHIFEQSPIAIELYDSAGKLVDANQASLDLFGVKNADVVKGFNLFAKPNLSQRHINDVQSGKSVRYEFVFDFDREKQKKLQDTSRVGICYLECCINSICNEKGEPSGYFVHLNEITDRKQAEILQKKQADELQYLNITKDKFFSIIAHDLKNPFGAISGFSELMLNNFCSLDDETLLKGLDNIASASAHAYKLLENLLIWSGNQTGRNPYNPEVLNLKSRVLAIVEMHDVTAVNKNIRITTNIRKNLPVFADKNMIDTILVNLISNAIKYSYRGGTVKVTASSNTNNVEITVADNGIGIAPDKLSAIFEIDKRTNTLGTADELGTGLGLIICKDFLEKQGGFIRVESSPGEISQFTISLPIYKEQNPL